MARCVVWFFCIVTIDGRFTLQVSEKIAGVQLNLNISILQNANSEFNRILFQDKKY
jgi:hypothetical protein